MVDADEVSGFSTHSSSQVALLQDVAVITRTNAKILKNINYPLTPQSVMFTSVVFVSVIAFI
jgi:hypothetical protein